MFQSALLEASPDLAVPAVNVTLTEEAIRQAIACLDLTTLSSLDTRDTVARLCARALDTAPRPAAVCVFPPFIELSRELLSDSAVRVATVAVGFPHGQVLLSSAVQEIRDCVAAGAHEVDIVFARGLAHSGYWQHLYDFLAACREACKGALLKVILGTGELETPLAIYRAALAACMAGADFVKTSTGKESVNATPESFTAMAVAVRDFERANGKRVGLKAAGGIRTSTDAARYLALAQAVAGDAWRDSELVRLGASGVLTDLVETLAMLKNGESLTLAHEGQESSSY